MSASVGQARADERKSNFNIKFAGAQRSSDNVVEGALMFGNTHTVAKVVETKLPTDFLEHPGCVRNMGFDDIMDEVLQRSEGKVVDSGALLVDTGKFTDCSPKDRYIVQDGHAQHNVEWGENSPIEQSTFDKMHNMCADRLMYHDKVFVFDGFVGASRRSRKAVRIVCETAWHHHFCTNMFIRPTKQELQNFQPAITILSCKDVCVVPMEGGLSAEACIAIDLDRGLGVVTGTQHAGEIKKAVFTMVNYLLPFQSILPMKCSATVGPAGDTGLFFGLGGTGKTTLSTDPTRFLLGDDEHGWDADGVFNLEGGCYARISGLDPEQEPLIYSAIRHDALLENATADADGVCNFFDLGRTTDTRASYPLWHIPNHEPTGAAGHATSIVFLTHDSFGVLPPVSKLSREQALYHFVSGYSGEHATGAQPAAKFSPCFAGEFMPLPVKRYLALFQKKIEKHDVQVYLVNTGRPFGKRLDIATTREIVAAVLDGSIEDMPFSEPDKHFQLRFPLQLPGIEPSLLNPCTAWQEKEAFDAACAKLSSLYTENFVKYEADPFMAELALHGPCIHNSDSRAF